MTTTQPPSPPSDGRHIGWCKSFNPTTGYGFLFDLQGGGGVFVHHTELLRRTPGFRCLYRGEYVSFSSENTERGRIARAVTGVMGGPLWCEVQDGAELSEIQQPQIVRS